MSRGGSWLFISEGDPLAYAMFDQDGDLLFEINEDGTIELLEDE